ncbi:MAG: sugar ABC transporter permease [Erysipelotrichaceae bacterium]|nr:sugar ABC transporter permease [Erysipelotrichaceae bacterium]
MVSSSQRFARSPKERRNKGNYKKRPIRRGQVFFAWSFILIPLIYLIVNWIFINGQTVVLAFKDPWNRWTLDNFKEVVKRFTDPYEADMTPVLLNTLLYFAIQEFVGLPASFFVSYFIYKRIKGYKAFRVIFYLPSIIPTMVMVIAYSQFLFPQGPFEVICSWFHIHVPEEGILYNEKTAKWALIAYSFFTSAAGNILFYSAMARIPPDLIDAGKIDGLTPFQEFIHVIFPLIMPTFMMTLLLDVSAILNAGPPIFLFGNPPGTQNIANWFFYTVYTNGTTGIGKYGYLSALGLCFTLINLPIVFLVRHLAEKFSTVEY